MTRLAVLASGNGTNLEAIAAAGLPITLVLADRPCRALKIATTRSLPAVLLDRHDFGYQPAAEWDRAGLTAAISETLATNRIDLVALAGFMTILSPSIFEPYKGKILNTHPSLLPNFKGAHAIADALAAGANVTGCTVHIVIPALDAGPILAQARVPILPGDTEATLHERIKTAEHKLYPAVIRKYLRSSANHEVA